MERKQMAKEMVCSIKSLQKEVAGWVGGWEEAARKEIGRGGEEDVWVKIGGKGGSGRGG